MSKSFKNIGIAVLSVLMAVCLTIGLTIFFKQSPIVTAASVNSEVHTVIADEDDFTYGKITKNGHNYVYVAGLSPSFTEKYKKGGEQNTDGQKTFNVCLEIPATLTAERNGIPASTKIDYVNHDAFVEEYYEEDDVITLRITDVHTPQTVFWYEPTDGVFKLANYDTAPPLENKTVTSVDDANAKTWAKMLGTDDGVTATVYDMDLANLKANFIVPSPMWYDNNKDGVMDNNELFLNVELLVDEQPKSDKVENGSLLRNMVISSGVTRFFSPLEKANRIKIEDTFRTANGASGSYLTGLHFATGRTSVLSIYGLAFQRFTHLETITLSAGVLLADGVRAFQGDNSVAVMDIAKENNSNVPSFYVKGDKGAIYTGDYRYSYYDTAGYRKWIVWDYVTRTGKRLGDQAFWDNTADNGDYNLQVEKDYDTTYTVTFDLNGAPGENFTKEVKKNRLVPTVTDPVWEGYSFAGWYTSAQGGSKWNFETGTITGDTELYAHWDKQIDYSQLSNGEFSSYGTGTDNSGWFDSNRGYIFEETAYFSKDGDYYSFSVAKVQPNSSGRQFFDGDSKVTFKNNDNIQSYNKNNCITPKTDMYLGVYLFAASGRSLALCTGNSVSTKVAEASTSNGGAEFTYFKDSDNTSNYFLLKAGTTYYFISGDSKTQSVYVCGFLAQPALPDGSVVPEGSVLIPATANVSAQPVSTETSLFEVKDLISGSVVAASGGAVQIGNGYIDLKGSALGGTYDAPAWKSYRYIKLVLSSKLNLVVYASNGGSPLSNNGNHQKQIILTKYTDDTDYAIDNNLLSDEYKTKIALQSIDLTNADSSYQMCDFGALEEGTYYLFSRTESIQISQLLVKSSEAEPEQNIGTASVISRVIEGMEEPLTSEFISGEVMRTSSSEISTIAAGDIYYANDGTGNYVAGIGVPDGSLVIDNNTKNTTTRPSENFNKSNTNPTKLTYGFPSVYAENANFTVHYVDSISTSAINTNYDNIKIFGSSSISGNNGGDGYYYTYNNAVYYGYSVINKPSSSAITYLNIDLTATTKNYSITVYALTNDGSKTTGNVQLSKGEEHTSLVTVENLPHRGSEVTEDKVLKYDKLEKGSLYSLSSVMDSSGKNSNNVGIVAIVLTPITDTPEPPQNSINADKKEVSIDVAATASPENKTATVNISGTGTVGDLLAKYTGGSGDITATFKTVESKFKAEIGDYADGKIPVTISSDGASAGDSDTLTISVYNAESALVASVDIQVSAYDSSIPSSIEITSDDGLVSGGDFEWDGKNSTSFTAVVKNSAGDVIPDYSEIAWEVTSGADLGSVTNGKIVTLTPKQCGQVTLTARVTGGVENVEKEFIINIVKAGAPESAGNINGKTEDTFIYSASKNTYNLKIELTWKDGKAAEPYEGITWEVSGENAEIGSGKGAENTLTVTDGTKRDLTVTAKLVLRNGKEETKTLTLHIEDENAPHSIAIDGENVYLYYHNEGIENTPLTLTAKVLNSAGTEVSDYSGIEFTWEVANSDTSVSQAIAEISGNEKTATLTGTGVAYGMVTVTVTALADGTEITQTTEISVVDPDVPTGITLNRTKASIAANKPSEFTATLNFEYGVPEEEVLQKLLEKITWTLSGSKSVDLGEPRIIGNKSLIEINAEADDYTLKAVYTDTEAPHNQTLEAECFVEVRNGVDRVVELDVPATLDEQFVEYQKLVYVPPKLKDYSKTSAGDGGLLTEFTFGYTATTIIGNSAFTATNIEVVVIPDRISKIEEYAFRYSDKLRVVYLPSNAEYGNAVFGEFKDFRISGTENLANMKEDDFKTGYKNDNFLLIAPSYQAYDNLLKIKGVETGVNGTEGEYGSLFRRADTTMTSSISDGDGGTIGISYDYRNNLTYEVELVFRTYTNTEKTEYNEKSITVLYNQMTAKSNGKLYVKDGLDYNISNCKTWSEILAEFGFASAKYGDIAVDDSNILNFLTGNLDGVTYLDATSDLMEAMNKKVASGPVTYVDYTVGNDAIGNEHSSSGMFTNTDTLDVDSWKKGSRPEVTSAPVDYARNGRRLPGSVTLTVEGTKEQINSNAVTMPSFQPIGTRTPDGEGAAPEITVTFDFHVFNYERFFSGFDENRMTATYTYQSYESDGSLNSTMVNKGEEGDGEHNKEFGYPYDAGRYVVTVDLVDQNGEESGKGVHWAGAYNGLPVSEGDDQSHTFVLNILKRNVAVPGDQQVLYTEANGAEVNIFESNAFYDVVKYSEKIKIDAGNAEDSITDSAVLDAKDESRPYQRGSYWVALKLVDEYNLQWVAEANAVVEKTDPLYVAIGPNVHEADESPITRDMKFVTCKLVISDTPQINLPSWTTDNSIGSYAGKTFTAEYREQGYKLSDIFYGYQSHSMEMEISAYSDRSGSLSETVPISIINAGTYTIKFKPATNYSWISRSSGCGCIASADLHAEFEVTVEITKKVLEVPSPQTQFLPEESVSAEFEYVSSSDGTWKVNGYKGESDVDFGEKTSFFEGTYEVRVELTDTNNYGWRTPDSVNPQYAVTELVIRSSASLGLDNPEKISDASYTGNTLQSSSYIDYDTVLTKEQRSVSSYTYDSFDGGTYKKVKAANSPESLKDAGDYVVEFRLPEVVNGYDYWWNQDATTNYGNEDDGAKPDSVGENKYYGSRYVALKVEKREITNVKAGDSAEVKLKDGEARLPSSFLNNTLYTPKYEVSGKIGHLNDSGIPDQAGIYKVTLTLRESAYRNYYFSGTTRSVSSGEDKFYPASITVTLNVELTTVEAPYVKQQLEYTGDPYTISEILEIPEASKPNISDENGDGVLYTVKYAKPGEEAASEYGETTITDAGTYTFEFVLSSSTDAAWNTAIPEEFAAFNTITVDDETGHLLVTVVVNQAEIKISGTYTAEKVYDGKPYSATLTGGGDGLTVTATPEVKDLQISIVTESANAKDTPYTGDITAESVSGYDPVNYKVVSDATYSVTINKATITIGGKYSKSRPYNGEVYSETVGSDTEGITVEFSGAPETEVTITFTTKGTGYDSYPYSHVESDSKLTVAVDLDDETNYTYVISGDANFTLSIDKATLILPDSLKSVTYNGESQSASELDTLTGVNGEKLSLADGDYAVTYSYGGSSEHKDAHSYTVSIELNNSAKAGNYELPAYSLTFEIQKMDINSTLSWGELEFTYSKEAHKPEATVKGASADGENGVINLEVTVTSGPLSAGEAINVGMYEAEVSLPAEYQTNYLFTAVGEEFTIKAKIITIASATVEDKYYDGTDGGLTLDKFSNIGFADICDGDSVTVTAITATYADVNVSDSVKINITAITIDNGNYTVDTENSATITGAIVKDTLNVVSVDDNSYTYNGKPYTGTTVTLTGEHSENTLSKSATDGYGLTYKLNDEGDAIENPTDAGKYTIYVTLYGLAAQNYDSESIEIPDDDSHKLIIAKAQVEFDTPDVLSSKEYDGDEYALNNSHVKLNGTSFTFDDESEQHHSINYTITAVYKEGKDVGENKTITVTVKTDDANHEFKASTSSAYTLNADGSITWDITGASITAKTVTVSSIEIKDKTYNNRDDGVVIESIKFADFIAGEEPTLESISNYEAKYESKNYSAAPVRVEFSEMELDNKNYTVDPASIAASGKIGKAEIMVSGVLTIEKLKADISDESVKAELDKYLTYDGNAHKTIAITNSPLSKVPKVNSKNEMSGGNLEDGKGGIGYGGSHPYFYLPLTSLNQYGLTIENFYGITYGDNVADGAIITFMFATSAGTADTYKYKATDGNEVLAEANIAETEDFPESKAAKGNYVGSSGDQGDGWKSSWSYANYSELSEETEIVIDKAEVTLTWTHHLNGENVELGELQDSHTYDGSDRFGEFEAKFTTADGSYEISFNSSVSGNGRLIITSYTKPDGSVGDIPTEIKNAGKYVIGIDAKLDNHKISEDNAAKSITVEIKPYVITQDNINVLATSWVNSANSNPLASGVYNVDGGDITANNAFAMHVEGQNAEIALAEDLRLSGSPDDSARSFEIPFSVVYGGEKTEQSGKYLYKATATLSLTDTDNFKWNEETYTFDNSYTLTVEVNGNDLVLYKMWYVVDSINSAGLLSKSNWTFGETFEFAEPELMHEQAAAGSYYTLVLTRSYSVSSARNVQIIEQADNIAYNGKDSAKNIGYFLNSATPAGVYRLTLHIAGWTDETNGAHTVYPEATVDYTITVRLADMAEVNDGDLTKYAETPFSTPYNGEVQIPDISGVTNGVTYSMRTGTAWSDGKYDEYFNASAPIEFSMSSGTNADYSELGEFKSKEGAPKNVILKTVDYVKRENTKMYAEDDYTVSYMFSATNYINYYRSFKVKITQVELELALEGTSTGKVKVDGTNVVWTANSALRKTDLTFNFKNVIESDKEDIVLRYAFYNKSDSSFTTAMDRSDTSAFSEYPQIAGDYLWRFTFENWNDAGNLNNNYKLKIASEDNVLFETKGGVTYAKPYVLFNLTVSPEALTAGDITVGDSREATYTGSKLTYLTNDEADTFTETPVGDEQFINVKVDASGNVVYYEAYIVITDKNYAWPEEFKSSHDIDDQGRLKVQFKINPAEVKVNWTVKQGSSEIFAPYVYNANDYTASAKAIWKKNGVDTTVSFALADGGRFKTVNQDGYTFTVNLADIDNSLAANFKLVSGELSKTFTVEPYVITKEQVDRALSYETTKEYDGKTTVNLNSSLVTLAINGENPKFSVDSISYNSANVKEASTITIGIGLTGDAVNSNYKLFGETYTVDGKITAKELTADDFTGMAISKVYDGTAAVDVGKHVTKGILNGVNDETVEFKILSAEYDEANAGERKVTVTIALDNEPNYILGETEFVIGGTITRARVTVTYGGRPAYGYTGNDIWKDTISSKFTATVNSTAAIPTIIYTVLHNGEPVEGNVIKDVGRYAITAQLDTVYTTNYEIAGAVGGVVTVTQINITGNVIERIEWSGEATYTYNGKNFTKPVAVALLTNGDSVELEVAGSVGCTVGKYTFAVVENSDYIFDDSLAKQFTVTVKPATVTIEKAVFTETYNGKAHSPEIRLNWSEGVLDESLYELIGATAVNAGKYDYKVKLLSDNYTFLRGNTTSVSLTVVAARVNIAETEFEALYTGEIQKLPELRLTWSGGELSANNYTVSGDEAINAGTYVYSVTLKSGNFTFAGGKDAKVTFVIEKVTVEKPLATNAEYVYDGSEHTYNVAESEYYSVSNATRTDAGTQTVRISLKDKRNYVWADGSSADVKFGFTVEKAQAHVTVGEINAVEYDGESHGIPAPQTESWVENTVVTYNGYAVEPINAGSYAIVVTVPETENYYGATVSGKTLVINKKALTVSWNSSTSFVEDGTAKTPYNGVSGAPENSIAVTYSANGVTLIGAPAGAGEYTVTVKLLSTDNYVLNGETTRTFSISSQQSEQPPVVESGTGENENFDALWYTLVAVSAVALAFAAVSTVIYIKRNKV